jgi:endonuclease-3 related protein
MIGAILTQNTNWRNVSTTIEKIKKAKLLDPKKMLAGHRKIPQLIKTSGFYRTKAKYLRTFVQYYVNNYRGDPQLMVRKKTQVLRKELLALPGIGPETADSILLYALGKRIFVVDAYTRRILSRHGIAKYDTGYDELQRMIVQALPASTRLFNEYHALLVRVGKKYCRKNEPLCNTCPLGPMLPRT